MERTLSWPVQTTKLWPTVLSILLGASQTPLISFSTALPIVLHKRKEAHCALQNDVSFVRVSIQSLHFCLNLLSSFLKKLTYHTLDTCCAKLLESRCLQETVRRGIVSSDNHLPLGVTFFSTTCPSCLTDEPYDIVPQVSCCFQLTCI